MTNRRLLLVASVLVVLWAGLDVQVPFYESQPGRAVPVESFVTVGASVGDVDGDLAMLTVAQHTPAVLEALWIAVHPGRELQPAADRTPPGIDLETYFAVQEAVFDDAFLTAMALAAQQAGYDVPVTTSAVVASVLPDGPSAGVLEPADVITALDGEPVDGAGSLIELLDGFDGPATVRLSVERDGESLELEVTLAVLPEIERPALGILVETSTDDPALPFDAAFSDVNVVGPSAGLMMTLAATDLLLEEDLAGGRVVAGTGTIDANGDVGPVGGVPLKVRAAIEAGADLVLVPLVQLGEAVDAAEGRVEIVGVATLEDALDALRGDGVT